jgi:hypothetical protein
MYLSRLTCLADIDEKTVSMRKVTWKVAKDTESENTGNYKLYTALMTKNIRSRHFT